MQIDNFDCEEMRDERDFRKFAEEYSRKNIKKSFDYILLISRDKSIKIHADLKLSEIFNEWPTQEILLDSTRKGRDTTRNILMKMNCKKGGINKILTTNTELLQKMNIGKDIV